MIFTQSTKYKPTERFSSNTTSSISSYTHIKTSVHSPCAHSLVMFVVWEAQYISAPFTVSTIVVKLLSRFIGTNERIEQKRTIPCKRRIGDTHLYLYLRSSRVQAGKTSLRCSLRSASCVLATVLSAHAQNYARSQFVCFLSTMPDYFCFPSL